MRQVKCRLMAPETKNGTAMASPLNSQSKDLTRGSDRLAARVCPVRGSGVKGSFDEACLRNGRRSVMNRRAP
jgi:hypothetical protein